jgi:uncharacterized oxidoreductase
MNLTGNTVLITGGTSGIGRAFAEEFLKRGNTVIICGRRQDRLEDIRQQHPRIVTRVADVAEGTQREALARWVLQEYPQTNVLINNAGLQLLADLTRPVDLQRIYQEIDTNLVAPIHLSSLLTPHFSTRDRAAIVNISSGLAFVPLSFMPVYCATKAAIHSLTLSLRHQLRETPVQVFEIAPPAVDTELGSDRRQDKQATHGGMPVAEFIREAMEALEQDILEAPIGTAKVSREKREAIFEERNKLWAAKS